MGTSTDCLGMDNYKDINKYNVKFNDNKKDRDNYIDTNNYRDEDTYKEIANDNDK